MADADSSNDEDFDYNALAAMTKQKEIIPDLPKKKEETPKTDILQIIEMNEKANQPMSSSSQVVYLERTSSVDKELDQEYLNAKRDICIIDDMPALSDYINDRNQQFYGVISCAASYENYLFVGNSQGYIRVFDTSAY